MPVGILYFLSNMTMTKQLLKVALTHVPFKVLLQLFVETMMTIYIYLGGIEYHLTTDLAIMIVSLMSLYMVVFYEYVLYGTPEI